jgi:hypothetical protein
MAILLHHHQISSVAVITEHTLLLHRAISAADVAANCLPSSQEEG